MGITEDDFEEVTFMIIVGGLILLPVIFAAALFILGVEATGGVIPALRLFANVAVGFVATAGVCYAVGRVVVAYEKRRRGD